MYLYAIALVYIRVTCVRVQYGIIESVDSISRDERDSP